MIASSPKRILIVEDEALVAQDIELRLLDLGYAPVDIADTGAQAIQLAEATQPDLLLMDIHLQGEMDGIEAAVAIRKQQEVPIVFLTAYAEDSTLERAKQADPFGYILKPFEDRELRSVLEIALNKHASEREVRRLNRLYDVLSHVNQAIVHATSEADLMADVCRLIVERGRLDLAWITRVDPQSRQLLPVASWGFPASFPESVAFFADGRLEREGNPGRAVREGVPSVCNRCGEGTCAFVSEHNPASVGLRSCAAFPLRFQGQVWGTLNLAAAKANSFADREVQLFQEVAMDLSYAMDRFEAERRRVEAERVSGREAARRRALMEISRDGIAIINQEHEVIEANPRFAEMLGYSPPEVIGLRTWQYEAVMSEQDIRRGFANLREVSRTFESRHRRKDGSEYPVEITASGAMVDGEAMILTVSRDISERKHMELSLRAERQRLASTIEAAEAGTWEWNVQTGETVFNHLWFSMLGYAPEELAPVSIQTWRALAHPEDLERSDALLHRHFAGELDYYECEARIRHKNGGWVWVLDRGRVMSRTDDGRPLLMLGTHTNITQRKQAEEALKNREVIFSTIVAQAADAIALFDATSGRFVEFNHAAHEGLGYTREEFARLRIADIQAEHSPEQIQRNLETVAAQGNVEFETQHRHRDGGVRDVRVSVRKLSIQGRDYMAAVWNDITDRKLSRRRLEQSEKRLNHLIGSAQDAIVMMDAEGRISLWNEAAHRTFGYSAEEALGSPLHRLLAPSDHHGPHEQAMSLFRQTGSGAALGRTLELEAVHRDGTVFPVELSLSSLELDGSWYAVGIVREIAERKRITQALLESERRLATLMGNLPGMAYRCLNQPDWPMVFVSEGCAALTGYKPGDLMEGHPPYGELIVPEDQQAVWKEVQAAIAARRSFELSYRIHHADGHTRWVWERGMGCLDEQGRLLFVEGFISDTTDRKRAEQALAESETNLRTLFNAIPESVYMMDRAGVLLAANDTCAARLGLRPEECLGTCVYDLLPASVARQRRIWADEVFRSGKAGRFGDQSGQRHFSHTLSPVVGPEGAVTRVVGVTIDITDTRHLTDLLEASEQKLSAILESLDTHIYVKDQAGRYLYVNRHVATQLGRPIPEILGHTDEEFLPPEVAAKIRAFDQAVLASGVKDSREELVQDPSGRPCYFWSTKLPIPFEGHERALLGLSTDVTARKRLEEQLRQAQKMEAVGQLAGGVAHDFNNILAAIVMNLGLMAETAGLSLEQQNDLDELLKEARRGAALVRQLLVFSRRQVMQPVVLDLNALVENQLKMLWRLLGEHIELTFRGRAEDARIEADPGMIEQVVMNLCVNARDAMPKGGLLALNTSALQVEDEGVHRNPEARPGRHVCLEVRDAGCGMDEATLQRIFEPFFTTKEVGKGTGLGLATVYGVVQQHKGWIEVESKVGEGTTFRVYLPATTAAVPAAEAAVPPAVSLNGTETLLLVEDEIILRCAVAGFLRQRGYRVIEAEHGQEALRQWKAHERSIRLLVSDMIMPGGLNGVELAEQLKARQPDLPAIILSGYSLELLGKTTTANAGLRFLSKPCEGLVLARTIRELLDQRPSR